MTKKRLSKALAAAGVASRRACEEIIFAGRVKVNGIAVFEPQHHVSWESDKITLDDKPIFKEQDRKYYLLNKPKGYLCTNAQLEGKKKLVIDLFPEDARLFTIGRLDKDTTGLLLVTNDGIFAQKVIHPSSNIEKEYIGKAANEISLEDLKALSRGAAIDGKWIRPVRVAKIRRGTFKIIVKEGKKHEIRILAEKAGLKLLLLKRVRIGGLILGTLPEGHYRSLNERDRKAIFAAHKESAKESN